MSEIMKHPWFTSIPPKAPYLPAALESVGVRYILYLILIIKHIYIYIKTIIIIIIIIINNFNFY